MDRISQLSDELLLKILSSLPAKDVAATMVLSKRWKPLWMKATTLVFDESQNPDYGKFSRFVDRYLVMHEGSGLEILKFKLGKNCGKEDIHLWICAANRFSVEELIIEIDRSSSLSEAILPRSLYTECSMLVELRLHNLILEDVSSPPSFPVLEILELDSVKYPSDEFVKRFLSSCPALDCLVVVQCPGDNVKIFTVRVPSLTYLRVEASENRIGDDDQGVVIDAPSLQYLEIDVHEKDLCVSESDMPDILTAVICENNSVSGKILSSITSVKSLFLCLNTSENAYPDGSKFWDLKQFEICTSETEWLNLLALILKNSPNLRALNLKKCHGPRNDEPHLPQWSEPISIPECLLSSLETLEWVEYEGTKEEKELVAYILRSGSCLKKVTISSKTTNYKKKLEMLKGLSLSFRRSPTCALVFN